MLLGLRSAYLFALALAPLGPLRGACAAPVQELGAGVAHGCALLADGTVRCWGRNDVGQLGDGTTRDATRAVKVAGLRGARQLAVGGRHSCALLADGEVRCWGQGRSGQLGVTATARCADPAGGEAPCSTRPISVPALRGAARLALGGSHGCALHPDGKPRCWGDNLFRQLGAGPPGAPSAPLGVELLGVTQLALGDQHSCALLAAGSLRCWGGNSHGQLGDGTRVDRSLPVAVPDLQGVAQIAAGYSHTCALLRDGAVRCWGGNLQGQLGNGTHQESRAPTPVSALPAAAALAGGGSHTCALLPGGEASCWGSAESGQLGDGQSGFGKARSRPAPVLGLRGAAQLAAGGDHTCALLRTGEVKCFGANRYGQLGDGSQQDRAAPVKVLGLD